MVECPKFWWKREFDGTYLYIWFNPYEMTGFEVMPWFNQRGGVAQDYAYWSAYEATLKDDAGVLELLSKTGEQPLTGYYSDSRDTFWVLPFKTGSVEFTVGETLTGAGGATGDVVTYHVARRLEHE